MTQFVSTNGDKSAPANGSDSASTIGGYYQNITQKTKLILPTAIWILIVLASICFLCLLSSLNRTLISLDEIVDKDMQAKHHSGQHHQLHSSNNKFDSKQEALVSSDSEPLTNAFDELGSSNKLNDIEHTIDSIFDSLANIPPIGKAMKKSEPVSGIIISTNGGGGRLDDVHFGGTNGFKNNLLSPFGGLAALDKLFSLDSLTKPTNFEELGESNSIGSAEMAPLINANIDEINFNINTQQDNKNKQSESKKMFKQMSDDLMQIMLGAGLGSVVGPLFDKQQTTTKAPKNRKPKHQTSLEDLLMPSMQIVSPLEELINSQMLSNSNFRPQHFGDMEVNSPMIMMINDDLTTSTPKKSQKKPQEVSLNKPFKNGPISPYEFSSFPLTDIEFSNSQPIRTNEQSTKHKSNANNKLREQHDASIGSLVDGLVSAMLPFGPLDVKNSGSQSFFHIEDPTNNKKASNDDMLSFRLPTTTGKPFESSFEITLDPIENKDQNAKSKATTKQPAQKHSHTGQKHQQETSNNQQSSTTTPAPMSMPQFDGDVQAVKVSDFDQNNKDHQNSDTTADFGK